MAETINQYDLDLDTLAGASKTVKLNGKTVVIHSPELDELFGLQRLAAKFKSIDTNNMTEDDALQVLDDLKASFARLIPELKDHKLNVSQLFALLDLIVQMAVPADIEELSKRGITVSSDEKKIPLDHSKNSQDSLDSTKDTQ